MKSFPFKSGPVRPGRETRELDLSRRSAATAGRFFVRDHPPLSPFVERGRLLDSGEIRRAVSRIAHEILERNKGAGRLVLAGIAARGDDLARRLAEEIERIEGGRVRAGLLDTPSSPDDIGLRAGAPDAPATGIDFDITG